ncbi:MFS transporter [Escherichia coli]|nr:MFS transporter [Escherichia coli]
MKNPYYPTALGLYFNYLVHGMGVILMSLNMASLETLWQTNAAGVSIVISSLGIGRLSVLLFAGLLSDRFGRRPFIMLGMCCYMAFFFGILHTNNIIIAYVFGFLAGMANSFLDAGTYPSLMEAFPRSPGTANILIKAFVSSGQFLLPLIISLLVWAELWFGWSFMIAAGIMFINALFLYRCTFPPHPGHRLPVIKKTTSSTEHRCSIIDLASYTLYGYISMATFYLVSQWYAKGKATGIYYSAGSIATFTIPLITAHLSQRSIADIMWFDTAIAAIGFLLALFIGLRSRKKTRHHSLKENVAPGG